MQAAGKVGKDAFLRLVYRFIGHILFELTIHNTDVDAQLIRAICARVRSKIAYGGCFCNEIWDLNLKVFTNEPKHELIMEHHGP